MRVSGQVFLPLLLLLFVPGTMHALGIEDDAEPIPSVIISHHLEAGDRYLYASLVRWTFTPDRTPHAATMATSAAECCLYRAYVTADEHHQLILAVDPVVAWSSQAMLSPSRPHGSPEPPLGGSLALRDGEGMRFVEHAGNAALRAAHGRSRWRIDGTSLVRMPVEQGPDDELGPTLGQLGCYDLLWPTSTQTLYRGHSIPLAKHGFNLQWSGGDTHHPYLWYTYQILLKRTSPMPFLSRLIGQEPATPVIWTAQGQGRTEVHDNLILQFPDSASSHLLLTITASPQTPGHAATVLSGTVDLKADAWHVIGPDKMTLWQELPALMAGIGRERKRISAWAAAADPALAAVGRGMLDACDHPPECLHPATLAP